MIKLFIGWEESLKAQGNGLKINGCICGECNAENRTTAQKIKALNKLIASGEAVVIDNPETSNERN